MFFADNSGTTWAKKKYYTAICILVWRAFRWKNLFWKNQLILWPDFKNSCFHLKAVQTRMQIKVNNFFYSSILSKDIREKHKLQNQLDVSCWKYLWKYRRNILNSSMLNSANLNDTTLNEAKMHGIWTCCCNLPFCTWYVQPHTFIVFSTENVLKQCRIGNVQGMCSFELL